MEFNRPNLLPWGNRAEAARLAAMYELKPQELFKAAVFIVAKRAGWGGIAVAGLGIADRLDYSAQFPFLVGGLTLTCLGFLWGRAGVTMKNAHDYILGQDVSRLASDFSVVKEVLKNKGIKPPGRKTTINLPQIVSVTPTASPTPA